MTSTDADQAAGAHLNPVVRKLLSADEPARIRQIRTDLWIDYPVAKRALGALSELLDEPRNTRMRNMLLVGRSANGKSSIIRRFVAQNPRQMLEDGRANFPVVVVNMPPDGSETRFWSQVLRSLSAPFAESASPHRKMTQALSILEQTNCRALIIDDAHNANVSSPRQVAHFLNVLKQTGTELKIPIVAVGIEDLVNMMRSDRQLLTRFEPLPLKPWSLDRAWLGLLASFEASLPLANPSKLASRELAPLLLTKSNATIGGLAWVLRDAAVAAIRDGSERITAATIERVGRQTAEDVADVARQL